VAAGWHLAMLLLRHRWVESLPLLHRLRRPHYQQDVHDTSGRGKHATAALPCSAADAPNVATASLSQDVMLLQIRRNAQTLNSVATALLKIPLTAELCLIHT
jgi:hypothetical protein